MTHLLDQRGFSSQIRCDSAGTSSYHIGSPPDRRMTAAALQRGIAMRGQARQFKRTDFEQFDLILAMDDENYEDILALDRAGAYRHKVKRMCEFCQTYRDWEVPDPYYGGQDGFTYVIDLLLDACGGLLDHLTREGWVQTSSQA